MVSIILFVACSYPESLQLFGIMLEAKQRPATGWAVICVAWNIFCPVACRYRRAACGRHTSASFASLEDAIGTIRCRTLGRNRRDLCRIRLANWQPHADRDGSDGAWGFFSAALAGLWVTPWIIPVAYVIHGIGITRIIKVRAYCHTFIVSAILRRLRLGGGRGLGSDMGPARLNKTASYAI